MKILELADSEKNPNLPLLKERLEQAGFTPQVVRIKNGIQLFVEGRAYSIPFGDMIETNFEKGDQFRFRHWTPTADMYYALAA